MTSDWELTTIGKQVTLQRGFDITKAVQKLGNIPVVSSGGISSYHDTSHANAPGVVLGRKGTIGTVFYINQDYWPHDTSLWVRNFHGNEPRFVYYYFLSIASFLSSLDVGTANPALNRNHVHLIEAKWPKPIEQRAIARILGALDDKIQLNLDMNRTLEALARAIFKSWFVDFDPVVAKADRRMPFGIDAKTAELFPSKFEDSTQGPIPLGWKFVTAGEVVTAVGGATPSTRNPNYWEDGIIAWATPKDLSKLDDPILIDTERKITKKGLEKISSGLLPTGTLLMSSRAPIGYLAINEIPTAINQGFIAMICNKGVSNHYVLRWVEENIDMIEARANGTTFLEISKISFRKIPFLRPNDELLGRFDEIVINFYAQMVANVRQNKILFSIRDFLIPRLMSGEVWVKHGEKITE